MNICAANLRRRSQVFFAWAAIFGYFSFVALERLIARDEGFYIVAAKLVAQGQEVYTDFFYPQMPLLPYLYGLWMKIFGYTWASGRLLSALFASLLGVLLFQHIRSRHHMGWAIFAVYLYCTSTLVFPWYTSIKTYALSTFCLFAAYLFICHVHRRLKLSLFLSGILLGIAVDARLFFVALFPVLALLALIRFWKTDMRWSSQLLFMLGFALAVSPNLYFLLKDFDTYWYNNMGYHLSRSDQSFAASLRSKLTILRVLTGFKESQKFVAYQIPILLYINLLYAGYCVLKKKAPDGALLVSGGLFVVNFLPTPSYVQYFSTLVPFLIIGVVESLSSLHGWTGRRGKASNRALFCFVAPLFAYYGAYTATDLDRYNRTGEGVIGIRTIEIARDWRLDTIQKVSKILDALTREGEVILSQWPGYILETKAVVYPGTEDHFGIRAAAGMTEEQKARYKVISSRDIIELLRRKTVRIFVATKRTVNNSYRKALQEGGYRVVDRVQDVLIYSSDPVS